MRFITLALICFLASFSKLQSQTYSYVPFPDSNAVWKHQGYLSAMQGLFFIEYCGEYRFGKDTILQNLTFHEIVYESFSMGVPNLTRQGFVRTDSLKRTYFANYTLPTTDTSIRLLYDFSLNAVDTLFDPNTTNPYLYIDSVDTILIQGNYRKRFFVHNQYTSFLWIEGIGSNLGPLSVYATGLQSQHQVLVLYFYEDSLVYAPTLSQVYCNFGPLAVKNETEDVDFSIHPNPFANETISITRTKSEEPIKLCVYALDSREIYSQSVTTYQTVIDATQWPSGIYVVKMGTRVKRVLKY